MTVVVAAAWIAVTYGAAVLRARRWPKRRTAAFAAGLVVLVIALTVPDADARLSAHMVQHALLSLVTAPLLVAGAPLRLLQRASGRAVRRAVGELLARRAVRTLTTPAAGVAVFAGVLLVVHVPAVYDAGLEHPAAHAAQHGALFWSAVLLWVPLLDPLLRRSSGVTAAAALLAAMVPMGALGAWLSAAGSVVYAQYAGPGALADQRLAGGIMWLGGMVVVLPALLWVAWRALADEERRQRVREAAG